MDRRATLLVALGASLLFTMGPVGAQATDPGAAVGVPDGMKTTFQRRSSGSFGNFEGPVPWNHKIIEWQGRKVLVASSAMGSSYMDAALHKQVASFNAAGVQTFAFDPPVGYRFPLKVGDRWKDEHKMTDVRRDIVLRLEVSYEVLAYEDVTVPAGTFKAFKVTYTDSFGEVNTVWTAPSLALSTIKRVATRPATHPQGAGELLGELIAFEKP